MSHVIAICGMMGSGKSTVIGQMLPLLADGAALFEDDFNPAPMQSLEEIRGWWERGGRVEEFDLSALAAQLQHASDTSGGVTLLETQFGRLHPALRPFIDLQVWIDVESDIAFARKVAQLSRGFLAGRPTAESLEWIARFCDSYVQTTRELFERQRSQVAGQSDVCISGNGTPEDVCLQIWEQLPSPLKAVAA